MSANLLRFLVLIPILGSYLQAQTPAEALISQPKQGEVVQGVVQVTGTASATGFAGYDLAFAFENSASQNWFSISSSNQPVNNDVLGSWDTTTITDGDYSLKLTIRLQDGTQQEAIVQHVLVRNYTAGSSANNSMNATPDANQGDKQAANDLQPAITANDAALAQTELLRSIYLGLAVGLGVVVVLAIYLWLRRLLRR